MNYRILVTGSREWTDAATVKRELQNLVVQRSPYGGFVVRQGRKLNDFVVVHGACPRGADTIADTVARKLGLTTEPHPAEEHGRWPECGPKRNSYMVSLGADICLAFPTVHSRGTWDCIHKANAAGIRVVIVPDPNRSKEIP